MLNIKVNLPLLAVFGCSETNIAGIPTIKVWQDGIPLAISYMTCENWAQKEAAEVHLNFIGFTNIYKSSRYFMPLIPNIPSENIVEEKTTDLRVCVFGPEAFKLLASWGWANSPSLDIIYFGHSRPHYCHSRWVPTDDQLNGSNSENDDMDLQCLKKATGAGYYDLVLVSLPKYGALRIIENTSKLLRPGGVYAATCDNEMQFKDNSYRLAVKFEAIHVRRQVKTISKYSIHFLGVLKQSPVPDNDTRSFIEAVCNHPENMKRDLLVATGLFPLSYPPNVFPKIIRTKEFDDSCLPQNKTIISIAPPAINSAEDLESHRKFISYLKAIAPINHLGSANSPIKMELANPDNVPKVRELLKHQHGWEMRVKGQKSRERVEIELCHYDFPPLTNSTATPQIFIAHEMSGSFIKKHFATTTPELIKKNEEEHVNSSHLVFPVEPGIANLMKLFGKLRPAVVKDCNGIYQLVCGSIETIEESVESTELNTLTKTTVSRKRAKLILIPINGPETGDYYEALIG